MDEVHGSAVWHDVGTELESVPLFPLHNIVLFPAQTLPLNELNPRHVSMFRHLIAHQRIFAVVTRR
jgi:Lon protease-like protein